ncbi:MAG: hypothetical protein GY724_10385 [Actinomycetia bacterium]|nr:hypothetical protein [Actinomycetes bacterium]MCP4226538.1 hypothetical protein [Actinomycetes bacterium]MCP5035333.1 hypothetical protein [Actinomycetes bacterium]
MSTVSIPEAAIASILTNLFGRNVDAAMAQAVKPHDATVRGLVTNENQLVAVIASDLEFAHRSGAALAMIPAGSVENKGASPDADLLDFYREVANVLSRLVDEATPMRVRLDPAIEHAPESLNTIVTEGSLISACETTISGYGTGNIGVWYRNPTE